MGVRGSADVGRGEETPLAEPSRPSLAGARLAALAGLAGAWLAAGSTGLLGYALRRGLTWLAIGGVVLLGWKKKGTSTFSGSGPSGPSPKRWIPRLPVFCLVAAVLAAIVMIATDLPPVHVLAVALVLVATAQGHSEDRRKTILLAAEAVTILGVYRVAYTSIGWFWLFCDSVGTALGSVAGSITGHPLWVGATLGGLDFLVVMLYLVIRGPILFAGRRWWTAAVPERVLLGIGAVLIGHLIYLNLLTFAAPLSKCVLQPTPEAERPNVRQEPSLVKRLFEAPPAPEAWNPYPLPKDFDKTVDQWVASWPEWCEPAIRVVAEHLPYLGQTLRKAVPWNLPLLAMLIHLTIGWAVLRYLIATRVPPEETEEARGAPWWRQCALAGVAVVLAVLFPIVIALSPHRPDLSGKKVVFLKQGVMNFLKPTYSEGPSNYGWLSVGMYGMLPTYLEMYGASTLVSPDVSERDLEGANVLVVILRDIKSGPWSKGFPEAVRRFVENGGTLLVLADHTMEPVDERGELDKKGTEGALPPFRYLNNYINQLIEPTSIRVPFDSAELVLPGWLHSYDAISHPSSAGVKERGNQFGVVTGASVDPRWPAYPLLIGRFGFNDWGDIDAPPERALLSRDRKYDEGEKLGDCILAAEQPYGEGRVVVFGDTTSFINPNLAGAHHYLSRLFAYLADPASTPQDAWRQVAGLLLGIALLGVLLVRATAMRWALAAVGLAVSLAACTAATHTAWTLLPDGNLKTPNNLAYIDDCHLAAFSHDPWKPEGIQGLVHTLMRNDFVPLFLTEITPERLRNARLLISIAPGKEYSRTERKAIVDWIGNGGIFISTVGYERAGSIRSLMSDLRFDIGGDPEDLKLKQGEPLSLGYFRSAFFRGTDYTALVRFYSAWPIDTRDRFALVVAEYPASPKNLPIILVRRAGKGLVAVIGDTQFAFNKNLEHRDGSPFEGLRENAHFWRWLISLLRNGVEEGEVWFPPKPKPEPGYGAPEPAEETPAATPEEKASRPEEKSTPPKSTPPGATPPKAPSAPAPPEGKPAGPSAAKQPPPPAGKSN
jgi:hypothetical protein